MSQSTERLKIALWAISRNITNRFRKQPKTGNVLIVFQQIIGDAVLFLNALKGYQELYGNEKNIIVLCRPVIKKFWDSVANIPNNIQIETVDYTELINNTKYFKNVANKYRYYADILIAPGSTLSSDLLSTVINATRRVGLIGPKRLTWPPQLAIFQKLAFDEYVIPDKEMMMIQRHRLLLNYLGLSSYKGMLSSLNNINTALDYQPYIVMCPGSSLPVKCWPCERFAEVADWIIEKYNLDVRLCGGRDEVEVAERMLSNVKNKSRVISHVGITSFEEWVNIIQKSQLTIGNDSGSLHIAAASKVKSVCVAGVYDKFQFFPYKVDLVKEGDSLPETCYVDIPCEYCKSKGYFHGYGNKHCSETIQDGKCALCVSAVTVDDVKNKIIKQLGNNG